MDPSCNTESLSSGSARRRPWRSSLSRPLRSSAPKVTPACTENPSTSAAQAPLLRRSSRSASSENRSRWERPRRSRRSKGPRPREALRQPSMTSSGSAPGSPWPSSRTSPRRRSIFTTRRLVSWATCSMSACVGARTKEMRACLAPLVTAADTVDRHRVDLAMKIQVLGAETADGRRRKASNRLRDRS